MVMPTALPQGSRLNPRFTLEVCEGMSLAQAVANADALGGNWTILLYPGTYNEGNITPNGGANITIRGVGVERAVIAPVAVPAVAVIVSGFNLTLDNLIITSPSAARPALRVTGGNCHVISSTLTGVGAGDSIQQAAGDLTLDGCRTLVGEIDLSTAACDLWINYSLIGGGIDTAGAFAHTLTLIGSDFNGQNLASAATGATTLLMRGCSNVGTVTNAGTGTFTIQDSDVDTVSVTNAAGAITCYGGTILHFGGTTGTILWYETTGLMRVLPRGGVLAHINLNAAIAALPVGGGEVVFEGTHDTTDAILLNKEGLVLRGMGESSQIRFDCSHASRLRADNITLKDFRFTSNYSLADQNVASIAISPTAGGGYDGLLVENVIFEQRNYKVDGTSAYMVYLVNDWGTAYSKNVRFHKCRFINLADPPTATYNWWHQAILIYDFENLEVKDCYFYNIDICLDTSTNGPAGTMVSKNAVITGNIQYHDAPHLPGGNFAVSGCNGVLIADNIGFNTVDTDANCNAAGLSGVGIWFPCRNVTIRDNISVNGGNGVAIFPQGNSNVLVEGNIGWEIGQHGGSAVPGAGGGVGIRIFAPGVGYTGCEQRNITIRGNKFYKTYNEGLYGNGRVEGHLVIEGNEITFSRLRGVYLAAGLNGQLRFVGNIIEKSGTAGAEMAAGQRAVIALNQLRNNAQTVPNLGVGLQLWGAQGCDIFYNLLEDIQSLDTSLLTADAAAGQPNVVVADAREFHVDQHVVISDDTPDTENNQIQSINLATNTLTMVNNLVNNYTVAQNAVVTGRATQEFGYWQSGDSSGNRVYDNRITGNVTAPVGAFGTATYRRNTGYVTESWGTATVIAGNAFIAVTHNLSLTPTVILVTPQQTQGVDFFVDTVGAASFRINLSAIQGVNVDFYWEAQVR